MKWIQLNASSQLQTILGESEVAPVLIFKHSTRCSISATALSRLERAWPDDIVNQAYYLDLIQFRSISNEIASLFAVEHESPQALIISKGKCTSHWSHMSIQFDSIKKALSLT